VADDDDEIDLKPKKKSAALKPKSRRVPARFLMANRIVKLLSLGVGGFVSLIGWMSVFGLVLDNSIARLILALIPTLGIGLLITDRVLKRFTTDDRGGVILDVFSILFMAQALLFVSLGGITHGAFTKEGDRYARDGSRAFARAAYLFGGKSPTFEEPGDATSAAPQDAGADAGKGH
jgi:hypothetical protein